MIGIGHVKHVIIGFGQKNPYGACLVIDSSDIKTHKMPPYCSCVVIQVSVSPNIQIPLEIGSFTPSL